MTTNRSDDPKQFDLLGYQLGILTDEETAAIDAVRAKNAALDRRCCAVDAWLAPLSSYECDVPADLTSKIEARLAARRQPFVTQDTGRAAGNGPFLSGRDMLALAAVITLFVGVFLPGFRQARRQSQISACANNLHAMSSGMGMYIAENNDHMPYAGPVEQNARWDYRDDKGPMASRALYRLVNGRFVPAEALVDPSVSDDRPLDLSDSRALEGPPDPHNNSYSVLLQMSERPWTRYQFHLRSPIAAGMTPLVDRNRRLRTDGVVHANSSNHGTDRGQNVLSADFSVRFYRTSLAGVGENDDIYRMYGIGDLDYTGRERPQGMTDAFLTP